MFSVARTFIILVLMAISSRPEAVEQPSPRRLITIELADINLSARFYPATLKQPAPAVMLLHGWSWPDNDPAIGLVAVAQKFQRAGYAVLVPTMRGWRPSGGSDDCAGKQVQDAVLALEWLGQQPEVDAGKLFLLGFSQGGQVALLAASHHAPVQAVAAFAPVVDPGSWGQTTSIRGIRDYVMEECGGPEGWQSRTVMARADKLHRPVLLVHGDADKRVPAQQSVRLYTRLNALGHPVKLKLIPGAEHVQDDVLQPRLAIDFFRGIIATAGENDFAH
jgi:dipeptidyl aminopeptidase/acylaminoacyl peptidase